MASPTWRNHRDDRDIGNVNNPVFARQLAPPWHGQGTAGRSVFAHANRVAIVPSTAAPKHARASVAYFTSLMHLTSFT